MEVADRLVELVPSLGVVHACLELALHRANVTGEDAAPLPAHRMVEDGRTLPFATQPVLDGHFAVFENHLGHR